MLIDKKIYSIGSSNFDYRSFRYQFEIMLLGRDTEVIEMMDKHLQETLGDCVPFDYEKWLKRPILQKIFEYLLLPLRHLL